MSTVRTIKRCLESQDTNMQNLLKRAESLNHINIAFHELISDQQLKYISIINIRESAVYLGSDSAAHLTTFRFESQNWLDKIKQIPGLEHIQTIHFKILPASEYRADLLPRRATMSQNTCNLLEKSADCFDDPELKSAFQRLSKNHSSSS